MAEPLGTAGAAARPLRRAGAAAALRGRGCVKAAEGWLQVSSPALGCQVGGFRRVQRARLGLGASLLAWFPALVSSRRVARRARPDRRLQARLLSRRAQAESQEQLPSEEEHKLPEGGVQELETPDERREPQSEVQAALEAARQELAALKAQAELLAAQTREEEPVLAEAAGEGEASSPQVEEEPAAQVEEEPAPQVVEEPAPVPPRKRPRKRLPINDHYDEIKRMVMEQRVVVVVGGTGCGKSTQVPQYILDEAADLGVPANVLVTQPRRMAAVTLARRVAEERGEEVGDQIGHRIRGDVLPGKSLSFATAGYLLAWLTVEPQAFADVTHIILDEAHERESQFELLILLVRLLMRIYAGPRLILMSATIESSFFGKYFREFATPRGAILEPLVVGSRRFPVEVYYLDGLVKGEAPTDRELPMEISMMADTCVRNIFTDVDVEAGEPKPRLWRDVEELAMALLPEVAEGGTTILVFVPGYADLCRMHSKLYWKLPMDTAGQGAPLRPNELPEAEELAEMEEAEELGERGELPLPQGQGGAEAEAEEAEEEAAALLAEPVSGDKPKAYRLFALHSQVPTESQELVLEKPPPGICHIVLATTIAESSLTLPEVRGVVDFGVHRTSAADPSEPGLARLRTEWCAQASLKQREGRTGRTRPGWCVRLMTESFMEAAMPPFNTPEVLRMPLTKLFLQAKGISDALIRVVEGDEQARRRLRLKAATPDVLLMQLPAAPQRASIQAAVHELAELGVLTRESAAAEVTVLGRVALWMPLDVRVCRLVWLGSLWGCAAEAVVLAAACSTPVPFEAPSRLGFRNLDDFVESLMRSAESRRYFDGGHFSEPLMCLRLFCSWARRLGAVPKGLNHQRKWFMATASLSETSAVDAQKMSVFIGYVSDLAMRGREMCADERGEKACSVREDLHQLVCLLRRPDLSYDEQRERRDERPPRLGDVFRAPAKKLYALLAAAFSDQLLLGKHQYSQKGKTKVLESMLDALEELPGSGIGSSDAILLPLDSKTVRIRMRAEESAKKIVKKFSGEEPEDLATSSDYMACSFARPDGDVSSVPAWMRESEPRRQPSQLLAGLPIAENPRLIGLAMRPRLSFMFSNGLRKFTIEDADYSRPISPYELNFQLVHSATLGRALRGIFADQNPMGFPCHITSPEVPLGADHFAAVAANLTAGEGQVPVVRAHNASLLTAEQLLYTMMTICLASTKLMLAFVQGPGGSAEDSQAALAGIKVQRHAPAAMFRKQLPGTATLGEINQARESLMRALISPRDKNSHGQEVLLWEDEEAKLALQAVVERVEAASLPDYETMPALCWVNSSATKKRKKKQGEEDSDRGIEAMGQIKISDTLERQVATHNASRRKSKGASHKFECPDCGERFMDWGTCVAHYEDTCHLDVASKDALKRAKRLSRPVLFRCPECEEGFHIWSHCEAHLKESKHLAWANPETARLLCVPPDIEALEGDAPEDVPEDVPEAEEAEEAEEVRIADEITEKKEKTVTQLQKEKQEKKEKKAKIDEKSQRKKEAKRRRKKEKQEQSEAGYSSPKTQLNNLIQMLMKRSAKGLISYTNLPTDNGFVSEVTVREEVTEVSEFKDVASLPLNFKGGAAETLQEAESLAAQEALKFLRAQEA